MKLRKIGNSLGLIFTRETLSKAGISADQELDVDAKPGEITVRPAQPSRVLVEFTLEEANALAGKDFHAHAIETALIKLRDTMTQIRRTTGMKIERTMNLEQLRELMEDGATEYAAEELRDLLVEKYDGKSTKELTPQTWLTLQDEAMSTAHDREAADDQDRANMPGGRNFRNGVGD